MAVGAACLLNSGEQHIRFFFCCREINRKFYPGQAGCCSEGPSVGQCPVSSDVGEGGGRKEASYWLVVRTGIGGGVEERRKKEREKMGEGDVGDGGLKHKILKREREE